MSPPDTPNPSPTGRIWSGHAGVSRQMRPVGEGWRLALGTLTVVRTRPPGSVDRAVAGAAMLLAPAASLVLALVTAAVVVAGRGAGAPALAVAALAVGALALGSRGLHLDGLADTADGLAAGHDGGRALTVMRRGDVGPAGAVTVVLTVLVQVACLAAVVDRPRWAAPTAALVAVALSRALLPLVCARGVPPARPEGLGATVAGSVHPAAAAAGLAIWTGLSSVLLVAAGWPWWAGAAAVAAACLAAVVLVRRCVRRLGGVTGDVMGAVVEIGFAAVLLVLATAA